MSGFAGNGPSTGRSSRFAYIATAGQTVFSGPDRFGLTLKNNGAPWTEVIVNGSWLIPGTDYTVTDASTITFSTGRSAGDEVYVFCLSVFSAVDGLSLTQNGADILSKPTFRTNLGALSAAVKADQVAATSTVLGVVPAVQQNHPSAAKAWGYVTFSGSTPTLQAAYNIASFVRNSAGAYTVTLSTPMSSANYVVVLAAQQSVTNGNVANVPTITSSSVFTITHYENSAGTAVPTEALALHFVVYGTQ